jgi:hypothetical protein
MEGVSPNTPVIGGAYLFSPPTPVSEAPVRQLDRAARSFLRLLVENLQSEQDLSSTAFLGEQDSEDGVIALRPDLPDISIEMAGRSQAAIAHFLHRGKHCRCVQI